MLSIRRGFVVVVLVSSICCMTSAARAEEAEHGHDHAHVPAGHSQGTDAHSHGEGKHLHFDHPLLIEVPTPHNVISFRYQHDRAFEEKAHSDTWEVGFEYAPVRWFSFELAIPYTLLNPDEGSREQGIDTAEFAFKFASFQFEERGIVLASGIEFALPTGNDNDAIGSNNEVEIEPFVTMGWKHAKLELISLLKAGLPVKRDHDADFDPDFGYQLSALYHFHGRVAAIVEVIGTTSVSGDEKGRTVIEVSPGIKFKPFDAPVEFGVNGTLPITSEREKSWGVGFGMFFHF